MKLTKTAQIMVVVLTTLIWACGTQNHSLSYHCHPCNLACDDIRFDAPGECPHCGMALFEEGEAALNEVKIPPGKGFFRLGGGQAGRVITVFYYRPERFTLDSPILMVVPGSGRSAESYLRSWQAAADQHGLLVLSVLFPERQYGFEDYHLGGLVEDIDLEQLATPVEGSNQVWLDETQANFRFQPDSGRWIFRQFDRIFQQAVQATGSQREQYDLFGHSAGGHILHRLALFADRTQADRIVAANASSYTVPDFETPFPFGLKNTDRDTQALQRAFSRPFTLLLGELDNAEETGGSLLRSASADRQGLHRLARGRYFFEQSRAKATTLDLPFAWKLQLVAGVGHDQERMARAAAVYLYGREGH